MILQHLYMPLLNFIHDKFTYRIPDKWRGHIITICFFAIFACQYLSQYVSHFNEFSRGDRDYLICLFLGIIIILSINKKLEILKWRMSVYLPYTLAGLLILIATLDHEMGPSYRAFPLTMLVAFMSLFYVWGNRKDYEKLFDYIAKSQFAFLSLLLIITAVICPYEIYKWIPMDYAPFQINPNGVSKIFLPGVAASLYLGYKDCHKFKKILYYMFAGAFACIIYLTNCRAGIVILPILFGICLVMLMICKANKSNKLSDIIKIIIVISLGIILFNFFVKDISLSMYENRVASADTYIEESYENVDEFYQEGHIESEPIVEAVPKTKLERQAERLASLGDRISGNPTLAKLDLIMAGRVSIWTIFIENMSWRGEEVNLFVNTEFAHNQYIELSYKAGIPVGVLYLIWVGSIGVNLIINFVKKQKRTDYLYYQLLIFPIFFITSMLDTGVLPYERGFIFLFYMISLPLFFKEEIKENIIQ